MRKRNELVAYAMDFASYLISKYGNIRRVILYGSVARGDFKEESDIDLFIDIENSGSKAINSPEFSKRQSSRTKFLNAPRIKSKILDVLKTSNRIVHADEESAKKKVNKILEDYYQTKKFKEWQLKGIDNDFSIIAGILDGEEWIDLRRSVSSDGIVLYGKFSEAVSGEASGERHVLFSFEKIKPDGKRVSVFRKLFGFKLKGKKYAGLIESLGGIKIGKGSALVSVSGVETLKKYFSEKKVKFKVYDF